MNVGIKPLIRNAYRNKNAYLKRQKRNDIPMTQENNSNVENSKVKLKRLTKLTMVYSFKLMMYLMGITILIKYGHNIAPSVEMIASWGLNYCNFVIGLKIFEITTLSSLKVYEYANNQIQNFEKYQSFNLDFQPLVLNIKEPEHRTTAHKATYQSQNCDSKESDDDEDNDPCANEEYPVIDLTGQRTRPISPGLLTQGWGEILLKLEELDERLTRLEASKNE